MVSESGVKVRGRSHEGDGNVESDESYFRFETPLWENVCTETVTPWKRLLPWQAKRGLANLLNARSILTRK